MPKNLIAFISVSILLIFSGIKFGLLTSHVNQFETSLNNVDFILWLLSMLGISLGALFYQENEKGYQVFAILNFIGLGLSYFIAVSYTHLTLPTIYSV